MRQCVAFSSHGRCRWICGRSRHREAYRPAPWHARRCSQLGAYTLIVRHTVRKNEMGGFIALYVTACLNLANPGSCVTEFITDSTQNQMSMTECLGVEGLNSAKEFVEKHPLYHTWQF